jgi:acyl carrier protein
VDKQKLTEWYTAPAATATPAYVPPANAVEMKLAEIWQAILGRKEPVGIKDSFFELGGNSIKAIRILSRVVKEFGLVIPTQKMFEYPTIEHLANHILNAQWLKEALPQASGEERERIRL